LTAFPERMSTLIGLVIIAIVIGFVILLKRKKAPALSP